MIDGQPVTGIILARGGSKRLPGKNIRPLGGKPMITWTIEAGLASRTIDRLILSSDDPAIIAVSSAAGCEVPFTRPAAFAKDDTSSTDAVMHALDDLGLEDGYLVLLQPTSPLRNSDDIDGCVEKCHKERAQTCATVNKLATPKDWLVSLDENGRIYKSFRSASQEIYLPNGAVYVVEIPWFRKNRSFWLEGVTLAYEIPLARAIDIDTEADFLMAQHQISRNGQC